MAASSFTWDARYDQLVAYATQHAGSYNVPDKEPGGLGIWLMNQRQLRKKIGKLSVERIGKLSALPGFEWDVRESARRRMFEQLKVYKQLKGDCIVPEGWPDNPQLAKWVQRQRQEAKNLNEGKKAKIDHERISELEDIGFHWGGFAGIAWDDKYEELRAYTTAGKPLVDLVPSTVKTSRGPEYTLALWLKTQRCAAAAFYERDEEVLAGGGTQLPKYDKIYITRVRIEKLDSLCDGSGWRVFNTPDALFEKQLTAAHDYLTQHRTIDVTLIDLAGAALEKAEGVRNFLVRIRANKRKFDQVSESPGLTSRAHTGIPNSLEQIATIEARLSRPNRPFQWEPDEATWQGHYEELKAFNEANPGMGCCVKKDHPLYRFVSFQREQSVAGKMTPSHRELLVALGFNFSPKAWTNRARPALISHTCKCGKIWTHQNDATKAKSKFRQHTKTNAGKDSGCVIADWPAMAV
mmetsp:Transcript_19356/g.49226  ORF Transcript_19356/g.49226 Transcript_19356/m.49226 type:complete len:465 (-) Transcript_19356:142-1536(-)